MGAIAPLSVLLVGMIGMLVVAIAVVRIAMLERKGLVREPAPLAPVPQDPESWTMPGAAAA